MTVVKLTSTDQESLLSFASSNGSNTRVEVPILSEDSSSSLETRLILAGFTDIQHNQSSNVMTASLPDYTTGTSVSLSSAPTTNAWASALSASKDTTSVIDEDKLLENDGIANGDGVDCAPPSKDTKTKRKPCKNCTCGLADMDGNMLEDKDKDEDKEKEKITTGTPQNLPKSECGSCNLGDAFRCASCPYLGLPPFKAGEKITVPTALMTSDI